MSTLDPLRQPLLGRCLIEASAGTGKTWAITSLLLRLLLGHDGTRTGENPLTIEQVLIVTFTRAATEELRGRIRKRLLKARRAFEDASAPCDDAFIVELRACSIDPARDLARLRLAEASLDLASIFTIHGFASRMLERNAFESGASFAAKVSEDDRRVVEEAIRDFWRERVYPLAQLPAGMVLDEWQCESFVARVRSLLGKQDIGFDGAPEASWEVLLGALDAEERALLETWRRGGAALAAALEAAPVKAKGREALAHSIARLRDPHHVGLDAGVLHGLSAEWLRSELKLRPAGNRLPDTPLLAQADAVLELGAQLRACLLHDAVRQLRDRLAAQKARTGALGYEDLLRLLEEGLAVPGAGARLAQAIRAQYPAALIDECQDTDPLQWRVFERIYAGDGAALFLVGDPKQAIYAFRGADVYSYLQVRREASAVHTLGTNYRSVAPLVSALNALFCLREDRDPFRAADMPYLEVEPSHEPDRSPLRRDGATVAPLQLIVHPSTEPVGVQEYRDCMVEGAANEIARMLAESREGRLCIGAEPLRAGHIACLVRGWPDAEPLARALARRGVPYVYRSRESVYQSAVAGDLYRLLLAVLEPRSERALRAALAGALLARPVEELETWLRDESALLAWQERFLAYRERLREHGVQAMFRSLLFDLEVPSRMLALPGGERRLTDCLHLLELLGAERETLDSDEALAARFAERMGDTDAEREEQQLRLESEADRVRIVTLHSSKGLQYEVVFLPFPATFREASVPLYHAEDTLGARYDLREGADALERADAERLAEDLRLLYVGLTRAVHSCVIGIADIRNGRRKESGLARTAIGWLLEADRYPGAEAIARLCRLPGAVVLPTPAARLAALPVEAGTRLRARPFGARIEQNWRASSYSALVRVSEDAERAARVFRQPELEPEIARTEPAPLTPFGFPRGPEYGNLLHGVLEQVDLAQPAAMPANAAVVSAALARAGLDPAWQPVVVQMVEELRNCALDGAGLRLAELPASGRVAELGFELPFGRLSATALNALLQAHEPLATRAHLPLRFAEMRGMLSGFIDLVFEYQGQFFVADFKSNHLGAAPADYTREGMEQAIVVHRYDLQYTLYTLALVRLLRARLGARFDYDTHIGGVYYLFLRGIRAAAGPATGVFFTRPARALIEALDSLFAEDAA